MKKISYSVSKDGWQTTSHGMVKQVCDMLHSFVEKLTLSTLEAKLSVTRHLNISVIFRENKGG